MSRILIGPCHNDFEGGHACVQGRRTKEEEGVYRARQTVKQCEFYPTFIIHSYY